MNCYDFIMNKKLMLFIMSIMMAMGLYSQNRDGLVLVKEDVSYTEIPRSYALIIGESNYMYWNSLAGVKEDVPAVKKLLEEQGFTVEYEMGGLRFVRLVMEYRVGSPGFVPRTFFSMGSV